ncbi:MAG: NAD(P)H-binding protein [Pseudomonadota bacterium]
MSTVLLLGATGRVGGETLSRLCSANPSCRIRLLSRQARPPGLPASIEFITGAMTSSSTMDRALENVNSLLLVSADHPAMAEQEIAVVRAAATRGGIRVVKISAMTAGLNKRRAFGIQHGAVEDSLRDNGLPFVILRPTFFYQSLALFAEPIKKGFLPAATGKGAIGFVDLNDVASAAARTLLDDHWDGNTFTLTGPDSLSMAEVASTISRHTSRRVRHLRPPAPLMKLLLRVVGGLDPWLAGQVVDLMRCCAEGAEDLVTDDVNTLTGVRPTSFAEYLSANAGLFGDEI